MSARHFEALTWLRGIAALFVVVSHAIRALERNTEFFGPGWQIIRLFDLGNFGVYLFFALSGCTLYLSNRGISSPAETVNFYVKRFMRIWPAFCISLIVFACFDLYYVDHHSGSSWLAEALRPGTLTMLVRYLSLAFNITGPDNYFNSVYWSIPVEFQFYVMFPLIIVAMRRSALGLLVPVAIAAILYYVGKQELVPMARYEVFTMAYAFLGGVLLGELRARTDVVINRYTAALLLGATLLVVAAKHRAAYAWLDGGAEFYGIAALLCVLFSLASVMPKEPSQPVLRLLSSYGNVSYSTYLFHLLFVALAALATASLPISGTPRLYLVVALSVVGSYLFSLFSYRYIELPSIALGRKLASGGGARRAAQAPPA